MQVATGFLFNCMFLIFGVSSTNYNQVKLPKNDFQYIINNLQIKYKMNYEDAKRCVTELEHFYTGIKYKIIDNMLDHPSTAIKNAWESHIIYTSMYFNFTHSTFGTYVHYQPIEHDKGQLNIYNKLKTFGINNMNETVWLLKTLQQQEHYSSLATWNTYYMESNTSLSNFNQKENRFLKNFIDEYKPSFHDFQILDIAMGQGRNSIWLAQKGYNVTGFDSSIEGVQIAKKQAKHFNLTTLQAYVTTIEEFHFDVEQWDLIICMYFPIINQTNYLRRIEQSLKYKGLLIVEVFHWNSLNGDYIIPLDITYRTNSIPLLFPNLTTLIYEEPTDYSDFGNKLTKIIRYVGQKHTTITIKLKQTYSWANYLWPCLSVSGFLIDTLDCLAGCDSITTSIYVKGTCINYDFGLNSWSLATYINLAVRSDNGQINSSSITSMSPLITLPVNTQQILRIPMTDIDNDIIKCRWANSTSIVASITIDECGGICQKIPSA
ncbi:unnamed protein product [Rotaria sp. Silwood1]|nr:unnamed protein product [Rotaria sp. Silwood1]CAF4898489.1 unnamed protein product [Rotaria sp. Silwood1]